VVPVVIGGTLLGGYFLSQTDAAKEAFNRFFNRSDTVEVMRGERFSVRVPVTEETADKEHSTPNEPVETPKEERVGGFGVQVENDFNYVADDIWYNRQIALEDFARKNQRESITMDAIADLKEISMGDGSYLVRVLAEEMVKSYQKNGDFSDTKPHQRFLAEKVRLSIPFSDSFGYKPADIWYKRLGALESLVDQYQEVNDLDVDAVESLIGNLRVIVEKEDDWRIVDLAEDMIRSYNKTGDFSLVYSD
jgi:hypothetical protein